jgi:hypothetical protein
MTIADDDRDNLEPAFAAMPRLLKPYGPRQLIARS